VAALAAERLTQSRLLSPKPRYFRVSAKRQLLLEALLWVASPFNQQMIDRQALPADIQTVHKGNASGDLCQTPYRAALTICTRRFSAASGSVVTFSLRGP
jgi:hypothetical protein